MKCNYVVFCVGMNEMGDLLKEKVRAFWDGQPCGTWFHSKEEWETQEFFDFVEKYRYSTQPFMKKIIGFNKYAGKKLLEVGCGIGTDLLQFARGGAKVFAIDLSLQSVWLAHKRLELYEEEGNMQVGDAENLPFKAGTFDVVYSFGVLHHTPNTQKAIAEIYRVLKPGGEVIIMLYNRFSFTVYVQPWLRKFYRYLFKKDRNSLNFSPKEIVRKYDGANNPLGKAYSRNEARKMLHYFEIEKITLHDCAVSAFGYLHRLYNRLRDAFMINRFWGFFMIIKARKGE